MINEDTSRGTDSDEVHSEDSERIEAYGNTTYTYTTATTMVTITGFETRDVRFPVCGVGCCCLDVFADDFFTQTSLDKTGSDAMNAAGDYSAAYCILSTDSEFTGHGMVSSF